MDWSSLPLELFELVTAHCSGELLLKLECVCKSWKENLGEWIWKQVATLSTSGFRLPSDCNSWKEVALKQVFTIKNMQQKRCITRSFASTEFRQGNNRVHHITSVEGDEALISWFVVQGNSYTTSFLANEMVNLTTGKRSSLPAAVPYRCALMTKNYFVTSKGSPGAVFACTKELFLVDRRTNETFTIIVPGITSGLVLKNADSAYKNGSTLAIRDEDNKTFFIVDLEKRTTQTIQIPNAYGLAYDHYFHGKYLALTRKFGPGAKYGQTQLRIYDVEEDKLVYDKLKTNGAWCIASDRVVCVYASSTDVRAIITDFSDKKIRDFATSKTLQVALIAPSVRLYGDILVVVSSYHAWFIDVKNSKLLCHLQLIGWPNGRTVLHEMIGPGKFVVSSAQSTRLIDFESIAIIKEFKPQIILPEHESKIVEAWKRPIAFHELMDFAREVIGESVLSKYASVLISQDEEAKERTSLIYLAVNDLINEADNQNATAIRARNTTTAHRSVNMVFVKFEYDGFSRAQIHFFSPTDTIQGRAILYKEKFVRGEWIPVDL